VEGTVEYRKQKVKKMKTETKTEMKTTLFVLVALFLSIGFVLMGSLGDSTIEDRTADNDEQVRIVSPLAMHWSRWSVRKKDGNQQKKEAWRTARCGQSKTLLHWRQVMLPSKNRRRAGTDQQLNAQRVLRLQSPFDSAKRLAQELRVGVIENNEGIQEVLNREVRVILETETRAIRDPAIRLDYLLHVFTTYGAALGMVCRDKGDQETLTILPHHIRNAITNGWQNMPKAGNAELIVKKFKKGLVTPGLYSSLYLRKGTPAQILIDKMVDEQLDHYIQNNSVSEEDLRAQANKALKEMVSIHTKFMKGEVDINLFHESIPEQFSAQVSAFREKGNNMNALKEAGIDSEKLAPYAEELKALQAEFVTSYLSWKRSSTKSRDEHHKELRATLEESHLSEMREKYHSWEIRVTRKEGKKVYVTMEWHLTPMTPTKSRGKKGAEEVVPNNHIGARYLLGPSNGVKMPLDVKRGYVRGASKIEKHGGHPYTGDTTSMQLIRASSHKGEDGYFGVLKNLPRNKVFQIQARRENFKQLYTMMNVVLGACPFNPSWKLAGLYSNPKLVESNGQAFSPNLTSFEVGTKDKKSGKKSGRKKLGPNAKKNRNAVRKAAEILDQQDELNMAEEGLIDLYRPNTDLAEIEANHNKELLRLWELLYKETVTKLRTRLKAQGLTVRGKKDELVKRLMDEFEKEHHRNQAQRWLDEMDAKHGVIIEDENDDSNDDNNDDSIIYDDDDVWPDRSDN